MENKRNLWLIPTANLSKVGRFIDTNNLHLRVDNDIPRGENINVYIISDEDIKKGDWCIDIEDSSIFKVKEQGHSGLLRSETDSFVEDSCKKIILTTEQYLIEDGVQYIDDEFLEWFVKNPSCKEVEIIEQYRKCCRNTDGTNENCIEPINCEGWLNNEYERPYKTNCEERFKGYKIIIPKDTTKYPIGGYAPGYYTCNCVSCNIQFMGDKRAVQCESCATSISKEPKQETSVIDDLKDISEHLNKMEDV